MKRKEQFSCSIVSHHLHSQREQIIHKYSMICARKFIEHIMSRLCRILQLIAFITDFCLVLTMAAIREFFRFSMEFCVEAIYSMIKFLPYTSTGKACFLIHFPRGARGSSIRSYYVSKFLFSVVSCMRDDSEL